MSKIGSTALCPLVNNLAVFAVTDSFHLFDDFGYYVVVVGFGDFAAVEGAGD
jgi:hypothetical protein